MDFVPLRMGLALTSVRRVHWNSITELEPLDRSQSFAIVSRRASRPSLGGLSLQEARLPPESWNGRMNS
jgi:hypothetical protein